MPVRSSGRSQAGTAGGVDMEPQALPPRELRVSAQGARVSENLENIRVLVAGRVPETSITGEQCSSLFTTPKLRVHRSPSP